MNTAAMLCVCACMWLSAADYADGDMFLTPTDDLPTAMIGPYCVAFTRNGAFVVSKDGCWIFDGGLHYALPGLSEWGDQIRRSSAVDAWHREYDNGEILVTDGTLCDNDGNARFTFTQRTEIIPGGLRCLYEVMPTEKRPLQEFGLVLHLPAAETNGAWASFWPSFLGAELPRRYRPSVLQEATGRASVLHLSNDSQLAVLGQGALAWQLGDDRQSQSNAYRLIGRDSALAASLAEGKTVTFAFDVLLGNSAGRTITLDQGYCDVDRYGRLAVWASTTKLVEGGLMSEGLPARWLFARSEPCYDAQRSRDEWTTTASGLANVDQDTCDYELSLSAPEKGVVAVYRVRPSQTRGVRDVTANIQVGFEVLKSAASASPILDAPENSGSDHASSAPRTYTAKVVTDDMTVELRSENRWNLAETKCDGADCYLLSTNMHKAEYGGREAQIRISTYPTPSSVEK